MSYFIYKIGAYKLLQFLQLRYLCKPCNNYYTNCYNTQYSSISKCSSQRDTITTNNVKKTLRKRGATYPKGIRFHLYFWHLYSQKQERTIKQRCRCLPKFWQVIRYENKFFRDTANIKHQWFGSWKVIF